MIKIAPEGMPWVLSFAVLTLLLAVVTGFMLYFFRDPERVVPARPDAFICPADGRILLVRDVVEEGYFHEPRKQISIFMSPFNVHVNRAPCDGIVRSVVHHPGQYLAAYREEAPRCNENTEMVLESRYGGILVRQVAGFIARRTVCRVGAGAQLLQGQRFGMIKFGSRVDIYLPATSRVLVQVDQRVTAGETVLAEMPTQN